MIIDDHDIHELFPSDKEFFNYTFFDIDVTFELGYLYDLLSNTSVMNRKLLHSRKLYPWTGG